MRKSVYSQQYAVVLQELRAARAHSGLTQGELAKRLEIAQTDVSKCERGQRRLDIVELRLWIEALGGNLLDFLATVEARFELDKVSDGRRHVVPPA